MLRWKLYTLLIIFIIYSAFVIGIEFYYRDILFYDSFEFIKREQKENRGGRITFFRIITEFGFQTVLVPILVSLFLSCSLNKTYLFFCVKCLAVLIDNIMKISYGQPRPFWVDNSLFALCDGGYGNPSAHAYVSSAAYLTLAHILTDYNFFKRRIYLRILVYILFIGLIVAICLSRLYLGVHAINQILYGALLGIALYFLFVHIIRMHAMSAKNFFMIFTNFTLIIIIAIIQAVILVIVLLVYFLVDNHTLSYNESLLKLCPQLESYRKFNNDGLFASLTFLSLIGAHYGIMFLAFMVKKSNSNNLEAVNNWNNTKFLNKFFIFLLMVCFGTPLFLMLIPSSESLTILFLFKISLPFLVSGFTIFGLSIFCSIKLRLANPYINDLNSNVNNNFRASNDFGRRRTEENNNILPTEIQKGNEIKNNVV
jgi:membrane-associated phospholipid phosphatase